MISKSEPGHSRKSFLVLPSRGTLSRETMERIRGRGFRARFQYFAKWAGPLKVIFFLSALVGLSYLSILQLKQLFFATSYFELKKIELEGARALKRDEVVKLAGVSPSMNILLLDKDAIRSRLLLHPGISSVQVNLDGLYTLKIVISERVPVMYLKGKVNFFEVAEDGIILGVSDQAVKDLPIITGFPGLENKIGESIGNVDGFQEAKVWIKSLDGKILKNISELNFSNLENPYIFLVSGEKVIPRSLEDFTTRYNFLCALLDNLRKNKVEPDYLDFRAPNEIVVKPRKTKRNL